MTINTTGQWLDTNYTRLDLANGVRVQLGNKAGTHEMNFSARYKGEYITEEIAKSGDIDTFTSSADQLLHWLSLARDWRPENEQSCKQRIGEQLDRHLADMRQLYNLQRVDEDGWEEDANLRQQLWSDNWGDMPEAQEHNTCCMHSDAVEIAEEYERESFAISVQKKTVYDIQCSWGGPSDGFLVEVDEGEIVSIKYYFKDWFDGAEVVLSGDSFDTAQRYIGQMVYIERD